MKRQTWLPRLLWTCLVLTWESRIQMLNVTLANISRQAGRINGMMWKQSNFVLWSQSWEIYSPPTDGRDRMRLSSVAPVLVIRSCTFVCFDFGRGPSTLVSALLVYTDSASYFGGMFSPTTSYGWCIWKWVCDGVIPIPSTTKSTFFRENWFLPRIVNFPFLT